MRLASASAESRPKRAFSSPHRGLGFFRIMVKPDAAARHISGEPATSGLPSELSLTLTGTSMADDLDLSFFGGAVEEEEEPEGAAEEEANVHEDADEQSTGDAPTKPGKGKGKVGRGGRGKGKPAAKEGKKQRTPGGKTQADRHENCPLFCREFKLILAKQKGCEDCYRDLEAMRRDAAAAGPKGKKFLKDCEKHEEDLYELWQNWRVLVGPRTGAPRCGIFKWMRYIEFFEHRNGQRNEAVMRYLTKKQFVTHFEMKGMTQEKTKTIL